MEARTKSPDASAFFFAANNSGLVSVVEFLDKYGNSVNEKCYPLSWVPVGNYVFFTIGNEGVLEVDDKISQSPFYMAFKKNGKVYKCDYGDHWHLSSN